jgi:hypothetical protein
MSLFDRPSRGPAPYRIEGRVEFLYEQDGPPEQILKAALIQELRKWSSVRRAYLARVGFRPGDTPTVALCLMGPGRDETALVERVGEIVHNMLPRSVFLDVLFLSAEQDIEVSSVCRAFYPTDS